MPARPAARPVAHAPASPPLRALGLLLLCVGLVLAAAPAQGQMPRQVDPPHPVGWIGGPGSANYELAGRWAPYKLDDLMYSTSVAPRWIGATPSATPKRAAIRPRWVDITFVWTAIAVQPAVTP